PDFAGKFTATPALAVRIGKLGKGIAPRFAGRYVDSVAPALLFVATDLLQHLRGSGLPWTRAVSYDRSLALGAFESRALDSLKDCSVEVSLIDGAGTKTSSLRMREGDRMLAATISAISRDNTLKTGDIILTGLSDKGLDVSPGAAVSLLLDGKEKLHFNIR
ncbi:MAG: fumarylacetoacetate hydrolase family protein, partial [Muribaculaceae bacterium]|nr:fumarylacetoacetate hydrolase family protein [Muribaculaceae bacterium]